MKLVLPDTLPDGWALTPLDSVLHNYSGNSKLIKGKQFDAPGPGRFPGFSASGQDVWLDHYEEKGPAIIISAVGARCGKCFFADGQWSAIANTNIVRFDAEAISHQFLWYLVNDEDFWVKSGSGQPFVKTKASLERTFALPPLAEQHRIVAKIEELFSELDAGTASLTRARAQLKTYRQALLKAAFEGKLTAAWREANADKLESPETLLARIRKERDTRYAKALDDWQTALSDWRAGGEVGRKPKKPRRPEDAEPIGSDELKDLGELPCEWGWARPVDLASPKPHAIGIGPFGSNLKVSDYKSEGIPLVFVKNITRRNFSLDLKYVSAEKASELEAHTADPNDILITKMGDPPGDCAIYPVEAPRAIITADCLKFRVWDDFASRNYVAYCIESILVQRQLGLLVRGVAQKKISVDRFKTIALPLPSVPEQEEIASQLDAILSVVANQDSEITAALTRITSLRQSILKKAFSGQLVPQDPADEPASALLERLAQAPTPKPRRKTKT